MDSKRLTKLVPLTILLIALALGASALPISLDEIEIDDTELQPNEENRLDLERGEEIPIDIYFTTTEDIDNMEIMAFISGHEYNYITPAADSKGPFDTEANVKYHKKLNIDLSEDFEEDDYKLRIIFSDRYGKEDIFAYNLKVDVPRHLLKIQDIIFNPETQVKAGSALLAQVRLENKGEKTEDNIKITVQIPELGVSATDYIDEIEDTDEQEETEEIYLRIPVCAKPGIYEAKITVEYSRETITKTKAIQITENEMCGLTQGPKTTITLGKQIEQITQGESATYPITITNNLEQSKSYTITIDAGEWAESITLTPASTILVDGQSSKTMYIHANADSKAETGPKVINARITAAGQDTKEIQLTADIQEKQTHWIKLILEGAVIILAIMVILVALVVGYLKLKENNEETEPETYY